jgi:predicted nucleic acid-binding protein
VIVVDTNVLSELLRRSPDRRVLTWFNEMPLESVWTSAITVFEIRSGLEVMSGGKRRRELETEFAKVLEEDLEDRVLPFDHAAANAAGAIAARQRRAGRPVEIRDVQIAGIVIVRKATLATRNVRHFEDVGVTLVDPWLK